MKITNKQLRQIIKEELLNEEKIPGALDTADAWHAAFMDLIYKELERSGWSIGVIGPEIVTALEQIITQIKKESDQANKDAMDSY